MQIMNPFQSAAVGNSILLAGVVGLLAISSTANAAPQPMKPLESRLEQHEALTLALENIVSSEMLVAGPIHNMNGSGS